MADNTEILAGISDIVKDVTAGAATDVSPEKSFIDDLEFDSLTMVDVAVQVEEKFGVRIPDDELPTLKTVQDAVDYVCARAA